MGGGLARTGISVAPDLADVLAVARGHQRAAEKGECEGDEKIERGNGSITDLLRQVAHARLPGRSGHVWPGSGE